MLLQELLRLEEGDAHLRRARARQHRVILWRGDARGIRVAEIDRPTRSSRRRVVLQERRVRRATGAAHAAIRHDAVVVIDLQMDGDVRRWLRGEMWVRLLLLLLLLLMLLLLPRSVHHHHGHVRR